MSTPAKVGQVKEERDAGATQLKVRRRSEEELRSSGTTTPVKVRRVAKEEPSGSGTTPVNVVRGVVKEEEKAMGITPVKVVAEQRGTVKSQEKVKVELEVKEEEKGTGSTPVQVASRVKKEKGTAPVVPVKVVENQERGTATSKVKAESGRYIDVKVRNPIGEDSFFRIRRDVKMGRLKNMFCDRHGGIDRNGAALLAGGRRLRHEETPEDIGLKDGDEIYVMLHETGN